MNESHEKLAAREEALTALVAIIFLLVTFAAIAVAMRMAGEDVQVPCITDAGTMSYSPTVCEKYSH